MTDIDTIIEFVLSNTNGQYSKMPAEDFIQAIEKHREYGTFMEVSDRKGLAAIARWNWVSGNEVKILDCIVRKDLRSPRMIKYLVNLGFANNKQAKYMTYDRFYKYPYRKAKRVKVG